jgi:hypothetical protein
VSLPKFWNVNSCIGEGRAIGSRPRPLRHRRRIARVITEAMERRMAAKKQYDPKLEKVVDGRIVPIDD